MSWKDNLPAALLCLLPSRSSRRWEAWSAFLEDDDWKGSEALTSSRFMALHAFFVRERAEGTAALSEGARNVLAKLRSLCEAAGATGDLSVRLRFSVASDVFAWSTFLEHCPDFTVHCFVRQPSAYLIAALGNFQRRMPWLPGAAGVEVAGKACQPSIPRGFGTKDSVAASRRKESKEASLLPCDDGCAFAAASLFLPPGLPLPRCRVAEIPDTSEQQTHETCSASAESEKQNASGRWPAPLSMPCHEDGFAKVSCLPADNGEEAGMARAASAALTSKQERLLASPLPGTAPLPLALTPSSDLEPRLAEPFIPPPPTTPCPPPPSGISAVRALVPAGDAFYESFPPPPPAWLAARGFFTAVTDFPCLEVRKGERFYDLPGPADVKDGYVYVRRLGRHMPAEAGYVLVDCLVRA